MEKVTSLPRSAPEAQGIPSAAIAAFVQALEKIHDPHSFMLLRHGTVVAEAWWQPYRADRRHMLFSLSKSFTSTAVGLAVAEGRLSVDDLLIQFFPKETPRKVGPNLAAMRIRHLLSMSTGHDQDTTDRMIMERDPLKAFLALPVEHAPGSHFAYNSAATYVLSALIQKLTGQTLLDYLSPRLFEPLGIQGVAWDSHPNGTNFGGWGLNLKTEDIARFGQLYLQNGQWQGRQLVPAEWVREATRKQVANDPNPSPDWAQGYGYKFWRCRHDAYRADGAFGQFCVVLPEQDAVLAMTSGLPDLQGVLDAVWAHVLPGLRPAALPADPAAAGSLAQNLQALKLDPPAAAPVSPAAQRFSGQVYRFGENAEALDSLSFDFAAGAMHYSLRDGPKRGENELCFGSGAWLEGSTSLGVLVPGPGGASVPVLTRGKVVAAGAWASDDTFVLTLRYVEAPFLATLAFRFEGEQVQVERRLNVDFGLNQDIKFEGRLGQA